MRAFLIIGVLFFGSMARKVKYSFSEFNTLFHFDDLSVQFTYLKEDYLKYEKRLENNIRTLNEIESDLMLVVEWNNNRYSGSYLDDMETLVKTANESFRFLKVKRAKLLTHIYEVQECRDVKVLFGEGTGVIPDALADIQAEIPQPQNIMEKQMTKEEVALNYKINSLSGCKNKLDGMLKSQPKVDKKPESKDSKPSEDEKDYKKMGDLVELLRKKFITIKNSNNFFLNNEKGKYQSVGIDKKCGTVLNVDKFVNYKSDKHGKCKFVDNVTDEVERKQSIKVFWNKEKFELISNDVAIGHKPSDEVKDTSGQKQIWNGYPEVYAPLEGDAPGSQNFSVFLLRYKDDSKKADIKKDEVKKADIKKDEAKEEDINKDEAKEEDINKDEVKEEDINKSGLIFIATHFKSKQEGFSSREKMGKSIKAVVRNIKEKLPTWDVILSGDLNAEIEEIAMDLDEPIIRLEDQMKDDYKYTAQKVYAPEDFAMEALSHRDEALRVVKQFKEFTEDICKDLNPTQRMKIQGFSLDSQNESPIYQKSDEKIDEPYLNTDFLLKEKHSFKNAWIELNNFPTEIKARVKEFDYSEKSFDICTRNEVIRFSTKKDQYKDFFKAIEPFKKSAFYKKMSEMIEEKDKEKGENDTYSMPKGINSSKDLYKLFLDTKKVWMANRKKAIHQYLQAKIKYFGWKASTTNRLDCFHKLFEREKIDFILLKAYNSVYVVVKKMKNYKEQTEVGFPNKDFSSDHVPTIVEFTFDLDTTFEIGNSVFWPQLTTSTANNKNLLI